MCKQLHCIKKKNVHKGFLEQMTPYSGQSMAPYVLFNRNKKLKTSKIAIKIIKLYFIIKQDTENEREAKNCKKVSTLLLFSH